MTQAEAQGLIQVLKKILQQGKLTLPQSGSKAQFELCSVFSDKDHFTIIANRCSRIKRDKYTLMLRYGKDKGLCELTWAVLTILIQMGQWFRVLIFTSKGRILEHGMFGPWRFRQYLEMLKTELKLSKYFFNTAMSTTSQA